MLAGRGRAARPAGKRHARGDRPAARLQPAASEYPGPGQAAYGRGPEFPEIGCNISVPAGVIRDVGSAVMDSPRALAPARTRARTVLVPLFDGVQALDVTGLAEVFRAASRVSPAYRICTATLGGRPARTSSGLSLLPDADLRGLAATGMDVLLVPGGAGATGADRELAAWLRGNARRAGRVAAIGTGADLLTARAWPHGRCCRTSPVSRAGDRAVPAARPAACWRP